MTMSPYPALLQNPRHYSVQITSGTGTSLVTVVTGGANGTKITAVIASATNNSSVALFVGTAIASSLFYPLATYLIPSSAGMSSGVLPVNLLNPSIMQGLPIDNDGQTYLFLNSSLDLLQVQSSTTLGSSASISVHAFCADF